MREPRERPHPCDAAARTAPSPGHSQLLGRAPSPGRSQLGPCLCRPPVCVWEAQGFFLTRSALEARLGRAWEDAGIMMERLTWARHHGDLLAEQRGRAAKAEGLRSWHCGGSC